MLDVGGLSTKGGMQARDTEKMEMRISHQRMGDVLEELDIWQCKSKATKRELLSFVGRLLFIFCVVQPGCIFVTQLIDLSKTVKYLHHMITLSATEILDIH